MTLGSQERVFVDRVAGAPGFRELGFEALRANGARLRKLSGEIPAIARTDDLTTDTGVQFRRYSSSEMDDARPILVFAHGGGWVAGDPDEIDQPLTALAIASEWDVLSVRYRLAPEHPYPAGQQDVSEVLEWAGRHATIVAVGGESGGGALAVGAARGYRGAAPLATLIGVYPALGADLSFPSYKTQAEYGLKPDDVAWFLENYLPSNVDRTGAIPLEAPSQRDLPPTFILSAEHDVLIDEAYEFVRRTVADGVKTEHIVLPGTIHGFWGLGKIMDASRIAVELVAERLRAAFDASRN